MDQTTISGLAFAIERAATDAEGNLTDWLPCEGFVEEMRKVRTGERWLSR